MPDDDVHLILVSISWNRCGLSLPRPLHAGNREGLPRPLHAGNREGLPLQIQSPRTCNGLSLPRLVPTIRRAWVPNPPMGRSYHALWVDHALCLSCPMDTDLHHTANSFGISLSMFNSQLFPLLPLTLSLEPFLNSSRV